MKKLLLLAMIFCCKWSAGQTIKGAIKVTILDEKSAPLENVTVEVLRSKDSMLVKSGLTDKGGIAEITNLQWDTYVLKATMVGYQMIFSHVVTMSSENPVVVIPPLTLTQAQPNELKGVTVSAKKPFIQRLSDRIVVNVEGSIISAGSSALDVLERSPGITTDRDLIQLRGNSGVLIMIDGKPTAMSGADLTNYLRGLPSAAIDRIEIITNPSARYEAAGTAGIIDIRLKKDQRLGTNGTATLGYGQGVYPKANGGTTFNYRNKKLNVFGNYNYSNRKDRNDLQQQRTFYNNNVVVGSDEKDNYSTFNFINHTARLGTDIFLTKNAILGFVINGSFNKNGSNSDNQSFNYNKERQPFYTFNTDASSKSHSENWVLNLNFKQSIHKNGELTADIDYAQFDYEALSRNTARFFDLSGRQKGPDDILDGDREGRMTLKAAKVDYSHSLAQSAKFELGVKSSYVSSDNDAQFFNVWGGGAVVDKTKTNRFFYQEYNHAAYFNYSKEFKKLSVQVGLRGEGSSIKTEQVVGKVLWDSSYAKLFPSAFFNYKLSKENTIGVSLSRRIGRPGYSQLNPFLFLSDATAYSTGNPQLLPQLSWSYQLNYNIKNFNFTLEYSQNKDPQVLVIARLLDIIPNYPISPGADSNISIERPVNLIKTENYRFNMYVPFKLKPWWSMVNNIDVLYNAFMGNIGGAKLNTGMPAIYIRNNHNFSLKQGWSAELNAHFFSGRRSGYAVFRPQWGLAAGVQKSLWDGQGTIRFNITDIFWTSVLRFAATYEGAYTDSGRAQRETRVANLSFIYRFGNKKVPAERKRITASEEERKRAG